MILDILLQHIRSEPPSFQLYLRRPATPVPRDSSTAVRIAPLEFHNAVPRQFPVSSNARQNGYVPEQSGPLAMSEQPKIPAKKPDQFGVDFSPRHRSRVRLRIVRQVCLPPRSKCQIRIKNWLDRLAPLRPFSCSPCLWFSRAQVSIGSCL